MDDAKRLRRDVAWNLVPVALLAVVGLGMNFMIGRWWGAAALGAFNLVTPAFFTFAVAGAAGLQYAVLRAVAENPDDPARVSAVVVGALVPAVVFAAASTALCLVLAEPIGNLVESDRVTAGLRVIAPGLFCFAINKVLFAVVNGLRRMRAFAIYTSLRYLLLAVGLVGAKLADLPGEQVPAIWTFVEGVLLLVLLGELAVTVRLRRCAGWIAWTRDHISFGMRGLPATVASECNSKLDVWMLGIALPDNLVGIYALASSLFEGAMQLGIVVQNNLNPVIVHDLSHQKHEQLLGLVTRTRRWFVPAMVASCALGALAYPVLIPVLVGDASFVAGAWPFAFLMTGLALASPWLPFNQLLIMASRPGWHTLMIVAVFATALVSNYLLIPHLGLVGAALSTAISTVVSAALLVFVVRWRIGLKI